MDRQCGRQLYDRTCCAKQMWERLRRPMNTKQSLGRNPTSSCAPSWEAAGLHPPPPAHPAGALGWGGLAPLPLRLRRLLSSPRVRPPPTRAGSGSGGLTLTFLGPSEDPDTPAFPAAA